MEVSLFTGDCSNVGITYTRASRVGAGSLPSDSGPLAWVRYGVEFLPAASWAPYLCPCSRFVSFSSLSSATLASLYSGFRFMSVWFAYNARCVKLRHDLVCITMPVA